MTVESTLIRWMQEEDVPSASVIEHASFDPSWPYQEVRRRALGSSPRAKAIVACVKPPAPQRPWMRLRPGGPRTVAGYCFYRQVGGDAIEVDRLAVAPAWRRRGLGRMLAAAVQAKARPHRPVVLFRVPEASLDAQLWLRAIGWRCVRVEDGRYVFAWAIGDRPALAPIDRARGEVGGWE